MVVRKKKQRTVGGKLQSLSSGWRIQGAGRLRGRVRMAADKSISHRALLLSAIASGESRLLGVSAAVDVQRTAAALRALGISMIQKADGLQVAGTPTWRPSPLPIDCGNSGTTMRLLSGLLAAQPFRSVLVGDRSLMQRPMRRIAAPLSEMGAQVECLGPGGRPPLRIHGARLRGLQHSLSIDSAQVRSALLLAGLFADGPTFVRPASVARDHTQRILRSLGVQIRDASDGTRLFPTRRRLPALHFDLPGDVSSAAFWVAAGSALPGSRLRLTHVGLNPSRTAFLEVLQRAGARIETKVEGSSHGEPWGSIRVAGAKLENMRLQADLVVRCIDEAPALFAAAALAQVSLRLDDAGELRLKESDRLASMARTLRAFGASVRERRQGIELLPGASLQGAVVDSCGDHRIAMMAAMLTLGTRGASSIEDTSCVATSYPDFVHDWNTLVQA